MTNTEWFDELAGAELSGITFVRNYIQLQFNPPPTLNVYNPIRVISGSASACSGDDLFANLLIGQIGKIVDSLSCGQVEVSLRFSDGSTIAISIRRGDYRGPEAYTFFSESGAVYAD